jgi:hypothetical protein
VHGITLDHLLGEARTRNARIKLTPVEELPDQAVTDPGFDRFSLDGFSEDERVLLNTFARHLSFTRPARELKITPRALRCRLERLKGEAGVGVRALKKSPPE